VSWSEQRARFPVLERLAYLNAGTFGPLTWETATAVAAANASETADGRSGRQRMVASLERRERLRMLVAAEIGVPAERVALTTSTTQGVQVVVLGLGLGPDDEVVTTDSEHFGLIGPLLGARVRLRIAPVRGLAGEELFEAIRRAVTSRTRLLALSAISWLDGTVFPWQELREATGLPVLVDGAQSAGAVEVDASGADWYTVSAQKWLCGPDGTGALSVLDPGGLNPRLVGYAGAASYDMAAQTWEPRPGATALEASILPAASAAGLEAALTGLPDGRFARARELAELFREALIDAGRDVVTPPGHSTLVSFRARGDQAEVSAALFERGVVVRDLPGTGFVRASVGWWNDESDLDRLVEALATADP
jgi:L-cysteine/cystine lyase